MDRLRVIAGGVAGRDPAAHRSHTQQPRRASSRSAYAGSEPKEPDKVPRGGGSSRDRAVYVAEEDIRGQRQASRSSGTAVSASAGDATMRCGSIAAEATAALGHTSKGKSGGVNGRGCRSRTCRRHQRRAGREALVQHHQRRSAGWDVPKGIEFSLGHHLSALPPWFGCPRPSPLVREQTRDVDLAHQATSNPTAFVLDGCAGSCHAGGLATCDR